MEDHGQGRLRVCVYLVALDRHRLTCGHSRALTVILLGFNNYRAGRMALSSRTRGGLRRSAGAASCRGPCLGGRRRALPR
jgi:hypothetical protein